MQSNVLVPIIAGSLLVPAGVMAGQSLFVLPTTPAAVTYRLHEDVNAPDGAQQRDQHVVLTLRSDGYGAVISSTGHPDATLALTLDEGTLAPSNPTTPDDEKSTIEAIGYLVTLADHQTPITAGQTWTTTTTVELPGGDTLRVPLSVTATGAQGENVNLAATGSGDGLVHGKGHSAKAKIDLVMRASFHDGRIVSATTTRTVTAHVIFRTITFTDAWSFAS